MDVLSDVLQAVRLTGALFFDVRACEPVVAETPNMSHIRHLIMPEAEHVIPFHIVLRGTCWCESTDGVHEPVRLHEGDIVIYPHGHGHAFVTNPGARSARSLEHVLQNNTLPTPILMDLADGGPPTVRFVCGYLGCHATPFNPLLDALPCLVLTKRPPEGNHMEVDLMHAAVEESDRRRAGSDTILARLSELLFVRAVRRFIEELPPESRGWLAGLRDPNLSRALQLIHSRPADPWTLASLSRECGMSRAVFAERFAACVGETPMRYLTRWRMQRAAGLLGEQGRAIDEIAEEVGYRSESAFNRAFKNVVGVPPGTWRRTQTPGDQRRHVA